MNPDKPSRALPQAPTDPLEDSDKTTPAADMQAEDAAAGDGATADAGKNADPAGGTPAGKAMKQQSKTDAERR